NFARDMTQGADPRTPTAIGGVGYASYLLGAGSSGSISHQIRPANGNRYFAFYAQDDFKVSRRFTLNAGLRWDFEGGATERYDQLSAIDPLVKNPLSDKVNRDLRGGFVFAPTTLGRRAIRDTALGQVNPRIGIVFELDSKTVLRSGYGIFFGLPSYAANSGWTGGAFNSSTPWLPTLDGITLNDSLANPFPNGYNLATGRSQGLLTQIGQGLGGGWPETLKPVYNQQWNFNIQRSLGRNMVLEVAYAGNKGTKLALTHQLNQLRPEQLALGNALLQLAPNPFYGLITVGALAQPTVQQGQLLRPYPHFTGVSPSNAAWGNSNYHALQTRFERRFAQGFSLLAAYTWSKTMADGADGLWNNNGVQIIRNWYCRSCDYSISSYDQPHRFVTNVTYELPFGKGKTLGNSWNGWANAALGQWQVNGILTISEGQPLRFTTPQNTSFSFGGGQTPDVNGRDPRVSNRTVDRWFDTSVFSQPKDFTFGNMARSISSLRNAGARNLDLSIFKEFLIKERARIELRGEAFNFTNTPLFGNPGTVINTATFGLVTSQENAPRQVQLGLKIYW
ncbi:MAG: TonB-dependent receptor, partial [Acidobacteria bacterium]|nr:TonB-dependent receptor [Acidobacteriota bacterium]